jgi:hypothetical protein
MHNDIVLNERGFVIVDGFSFYLDVMEISKFCSRNFIFYKNLKHTIYLKHDTNYNYLY